MRCPEQKVKSKSRRVDGPGRSTVRGDASHRIRYAIGSRPIVTLNRRPQNRCGPGMARVRFPAQLWSCRMAKQQLIVSGASQMPALIKKLWGPPPIPRTEDPAVYWKLGLAMAEAVQPADPIEWMYLKDVVDYTWEIRRLRKYKVELIAIQEKSSLARPGRYSSPKRCGMGRAFCDGARRDRGCFSRTWSPLRASIGCSMWPKAAERRP